MVGDSEGRGVVDDAGKGCRCHLTTAGDLKTVRTNPPPGETGLSHLHLLFSPLQPNCQLTLMNLSNKGIINILCFYFNFIGCLSLLSSLIF